MKTIVSKLLFLTLVLCLSASTYAENKMLEKLKIVIPKVRFENHSIADVTSFIKKMSKNLDPESKGINIVLMKDASESKAKINLDADSMPVAELIKYVCQQANLSYKVEKFAVVIGNKAGLHQMTTKFYLAQNKVISIIDQSFKGDTEAFMKQIGIKFPPGSKVTLVRSMNRIVLTNTADAHEKVSSLLKPL